MSDEVIMLASKFNLDKAKFPITMSEKIDGVPVDIFWNKVKWDSRTRQGEPVYSIKHITDWFNKNVPNSFDAPTHFIGELHIQGMDFKDISGHVRRKANTPESAKLRLHLFDYYTEGNEDLGYAERMHLLRKCIDDSKTVRVVPSYEAYSKAEYLETRKRIIKANETGRPTGSEGIIVRTASEGYKVAKRPKGYAKDKVEDTIDIPLEGYEEAVSKTGTHLGMIGRLISTYNGKPIGVGPGKLDHEERTRIFQQWPKDRGRIMEVAYMPDTSYEALREGRFSVWRDDKSVQ